MKNVMSILTFQERQPITDWHPIYMAMTIDGNPVIFADKKDAKGLVSSGNNYSKRHGCNWILRQRTTWGGYAVYKRGMTLLEKKQRNERIKLSLASQDFQPATA